MHQLITCYSHSHIYCLLFWNHFAYLYQLIDRSFSTYLRRLAIILHLCIDLLIGHSFPICAILVITAFFCISLTHCLVYLLRYFLSICASWVIATSTYILLIYYLVYLLHCFPLIVLTYWSLQFLTLHWLIDCCDLTYIAHHFIAWCYPICVHILLPNIFLFCTYFYAAYKSQ